MLNFCENSFNETTKKNALEIFLKKRKNGRKPNLKKKKTKE
jgi:hypothetical protein